MPVVRYTSAAAADLEAIGDGVAAAGRASAGHFLSSVRLHCRQLARVKTMGHACPDLGERVRCFMIGHYEIYYALSDDGADILRVIEQDEVDAEET